MSDSTERGINVLKQHLSILPGHISNLVLEHIRQSINYKPVIGIMGKTGVGKSSLCNALFEHPLSPVSHAEGCTRKPLHFTLNAGERSLTLVDLPGAGESLKHDEIYRQMYQEQLPKLDLILWVMKADDRACTTDEEFHRFLLDCGVSTDSIVFVINQADKAEPSLEWDREKGSPSAEQLMTLTARSAAVSRQFFTPYPVHAVSAKTGYNMSSMVETIIFALPPEATSGVFRQIREEHRTKESETKARKDFADLLGELLSRILEAIPLPSVIRNGLGVLREGLENAATSIWHWFF
ncbi:TPA: GTPase family protein [Klebsiella variicola subsp. variicola]|uniref:GTPase family protein n=1 Tax=Enterobacteriaceae TaxID=543 RepID=UPI000793EBA1|nr:MULTISPECIES: GTPase [Enterobacteriaceae]HDT0540062.1 50S ribosome-binding GTPase [Klebsiella variicola]MBJ8866727.1 50S ribosome-binding GTPase [Citrobacter koseri]MDE8815293.1 50S ribosome-binding GTPase [Citrobacter freundii]SAD96797.1 putative GTPase [Enterobacter cloacae]HCT5369034.1 50S ribosome-binding GTPase [Citrobacter koseri]